MLVLLAVVLALTPPLINANRLARRIATSMSDSLGRPVHLDNVSVHALPFPGLTIDNLVVSDDPTFSAEPVIRANKVTARLRLSSLWRRQVEVSTILFDVDEHGSGPSVNLVRRPDGRWNIESILLRAARQNTAPTAQAHASSVPRFPYIEATGARLNVKMGNEKEPLSLTEADFALWLPSPQQWRLRLTGKPARTNTSVSDTGVLNVEATLQRAESLDDVPIDLTASWRRAPLGEASRVLTGFDAGWRGNVDVSGTAVGTLGRAKVVSRIILTDVRRADFIPAKMMHVEAECRGQLSATLALVAEPACSLPAEDAKGEPRGTIAATADQLELIGLHLNGLRFGMSDVPDGWALDWARLFSQRLATGIKTSGIMSGSVAKGSDGWTGEMHDVFRVMGEDAEAERDRYRRDTCCIRAADGRRRRHRTRQPCAAWPANSDVKRKRKPARLHAPVERYGK